jgi:hypothetical protein
VLCNVSAYHYEIAIELTPHENAGYLREGDPFVSAVTMSVQHSPQSYRSRH